MKNQTQRAIELDKKYLWHPFTQMADWLESQPVVIDSADGFHLIDTEGNKYIDGISSLWCNVHGHRVKEIDEALKKQIDKISHSTLLGLGQSRSIELAEKLVQVTPPGLDKVFYSDSGATAAEIALKMAYQYHRNKGDVKRDKFVALANSYHGDTIGSVSLGGIETFHSIFRPLLFETYYIPPPHPYRFKGTKEQCLQYSIEQAEQILQEKSDRIAAFVVEPLVQGAAGIIVHPPGFLKAVRRLTKKYGVLLIADEVATGFGKTGRMFACEKEDVSPDFMCLAKGLSGGYLPLAATLTTNEIYNAFLDKQKRGKTFYHGHTYTGNALGCAAALASLELFGKNNILGSLPPKIEMMHRYFEKLAKLPYVGDARDCGLMGSFEIVRESSETPDSSGPQSFPAALRIGAKLCESMRPAGLMLRPLGDCVIVMPPVAIPENLLEEMLDIILKSTEKNLPDIVK